MYGGVLILADYRKDYRDEMLELARMFNRKRLTTRQRDEVFEQLQNSKTNMLGMSIRTEE